MSATMHWCVWGTAPFGALLGGLPGTTLGLREALLIAGISGVGESLTFVPLLFGPVWKIAEMPTGVAEK
jgi:hypothetical protein